MVIDSMDHVRQLLYSSTPSRNQRIVLATAIAVMSGFFAAQQFELDRPHSDFGMLWFGARALIANQDPYALIGPGRVFNYDWPLIYPATALVAVVPLVVFSEQMATGIFVAISTWLLAFGITKDGWYRIPLFTTGAFIASAKLGQWSILFTAALFFPALAFFSAVKPQAALPILAASTNRRALWAALIGGIVLLSGSLLLDAHWIPGWLAAVNRSANMDPPILRFGGPILLITLLRWRRPETWLLLTLAASPQSWGWYNTLPLFTIPQSFGESVLLAAVALFGGWYADNMLSPGSLDELVRSVGTTIVLTIYIPSAILILRRPNETELPAWLSPITSLRRTDRQHEIDSVSKRGQ